MVSSKRLNSAGDLFTCSSNSAGEFFTVVKSVISNIENCYLKVEAICTGNYPLNVNMFKLFSSDVNTLNPNVHHHVNQSRKLFLLLYFVHNLKSIRKDWLNLKDYDHTFTYPNQLIFHKYDEVNKIHVARFQDIRLLYKSEQSSLLKQAHRLSSKACWPTMLERQNVNLALKILDQLTYEAL